MRRTKADIDSIKLSIYDLCARYQPMTVRQLFYQLTTIGAIDKTEQEYKGTVCRLTKEMRLNGELPWDWLADNTRWMHKPRTYGGISDLLESSQRAYRRALWDPSTNPDYCEVWIEKDALTGVFLGLVVFRQDFVIIMTMIGIISLAGVVVNNAIVLIDYTNLLIDRRKEELRLGEDDLLPFPEIVPLLIQGGRTRLRPVLLTAITTVLGLLPLAIGINVDFFSLLAEYDAKMYIGGDNNIFWKPMSWAIIYGLTFATFLTLVIVPVMMWYLTRAQYKWVKRLPLT